MTHRLTAVALTLALAWAAPAMAANKEHQQLMADIRMLQEQTQQLQALLGVLNEALKAVNTRLAEQAEATRKALADQKLVIDTLANDLRVVREKVDDSNVRLGSLTQEVDALRQTVTQAVAQPRMSTADPSGAAAGDVPPPPAPTGVAAVGASPQRLWDGAMADYYAGQYDLAILGFESYVKSFPKSDQADDAQVNIGNSYLNDGKNEKAIAAYDLAIRLYPGGNAIPEAHFKKGLALRNLKRVDEARSAFEFVIKTFPDSDAARLAQTQLQQLAKR